MEPQLAQVTLAAIQRPVDDALERVFDELARIIAADFPLIDEVNRHLLRLRGKLFRPTLLLLSAEASGRVKPRHISLAAVVELIHLATLIHDDSVDHSALRRGQPTVNAQFTHEVAVIMGDFLYSRAIIELVRLDDLEPLRILSQVTNDLTVGEMREIEAHDELSFSEREYERLIAAKTASLMAGACEVGALEGDPGCRAPLRRFGRNLGMAFQIADDVLDYVGTEAVTGKPAGLDLREHKITLPLIAALPNMTVDERAAVETLMADPTPSDAAVSRVIRVVEERGGIAVARDRAQEFALQAEAELDTLPPTPARDALRASLSYAVERPS